MSTENPPRSKGAAAASSSAAGAGSASRSRTGRSGRSSHGASSEGSARPARTERSDSILARDSDRARGGGRAVTGRAEGTRTGGGAATRRRGDALEAALLEAAWDEMCDVGYPKLTMEAVARRAHTSVPVLYRRWPNKSELAVAALTQYRLAHFVDPEPKDTLRENLIEAMALVNERRDYFRIVTGAVFNGLLGDLNMSPDELRGQFFTARPPWMDTIYGRAEKNGEIDLKATPAAVLSMPFDLLRHDLLMSMRPLSRARIEEIIDVLFLPLIHKPEAEAAIVTKQG